MNRVLYTLWLIIKNAAIGLFYLAVTIGSIAAFIGLMYVLFNTTPGHYIITALFFGVLGLCVVMFVRECWVEACKKYDA